MPTLPHHARDWAESFGAQAERIAAPDVLDESLTMPYAAVAISAITRET